jgi:hypothetical protein
MSACLTATFTRLVPENFTSAVMSVSEFTNATRIEYTYDPAATASRCTNQVTGFLCIQVNATDLVAYRVPDAISLPVNSSELNSACNTFRNDNGVEDGWFTYMHFSYDTLVDKPTTYGFDPNVTRIVNGDAAMTWDEFIAVRTADYAVAVNTPVGAPGANCNDWQNDEMTQVFNVTTWDRVSIPCVEAFEWGRICTCYQY